MSLDNASRGHSLNTFIVIGTLLFGGCCSNVVALELLIGLVGRLQ